MVTTEHRLQHDAKPDRWGIIRRHHITYHFQYAKVQQVVEVPKAFCTVPVASKHEILPSSDHLPSHHHQFTCTWTGQALKQFTKTNFTTTNCLMKHNSSNHHLDYSWTTTSLVHSATAQWCRMIVVYWLHATEPKLTTGINQQTLLRPPSPSKYTNTPWQCIMLVL